MELEKVVQQGCYTIHLGPIRGFEPGEGNYEMKVIGFDLKNSEYSSSVVPINVNIKGYEFVVPSNYTCSNAPA